METTTERMLNKIAEDMSPSIEVVDELQKLGYDEIFELAGNKLMFVQAGLFFYPREFKVDHVIRIDQLGSCFGLSHQSGKFKGIFMAYTSYWPKNAL